MRRSVFFYDGMSYLRGFSCAREGQQVERVLGTRERCDVLWGGDVVVGSNLKRGLEVWWFGTGLPCKHGSSESKVMFLHPREIYCLAGGNTMLIQSPVVV